MRLISLLSVCVALACGQLFVDPSSQNHQLAIDALKKAVEQIPANTEAHLKLAEAYAARWIPGLGSEANQDNLKQAIAEYRAVLQLEPYNKAALQALGELAYNDVLTDRIKRMMLERGHPLLVNAAREAILQYVYHPFLVDGRPAEVSTEVTVQFALP
jgi:tetratricopeptide (TPR) repeat protein